MDEKTRKHLRKFGKLFSSTTLSMCNNSLMKEAINGEKTKKENEIIKDAAKRGKEIRERNEGLFKKPPTEITFSENPFSTEECGEKFRLQVEESIKESIKVREECFCKLLAKHTGLSDSNRDNKWLELLREAENEHLSIFLPPGKILQILKLIPGNVIVKDGNCGTSYTREEFKSLVSLRNHILCGPDISYGFFSRIHSFLFYRSGGKMVVTLKAQQVMEKEDQILEDKSNSSPPLKTTESRRSNSVNPPVYIEGTPIRIMPNSLELTKGLDEWLGKKRSVISPIEKPKKKSLVNYLREREEPIGELKKEPLSISALQLGEVGIRYNPNIKKM